MEKDLLIELIRGTNNDDIIHYLYLFVNDFILMHSKESKPCSEDVKAADGLIAI